MRAKKIVGDTIVYVVLAFMVVVWVFPLIWLVLQSFSGETGSGSSVRFMPISWSTDPYVQLFTNTIERNGQLVASDYNFFGYVENGVFYPGAFLNTIWISIVVMIVSTLFTLMAAYAFSRLRFKSRTKMMRVILILGMFPGFITLIVLKEVFGMIGLSQNLWALVIIYCGGAGMNYYISKGFFDTISRQIDEAAMVDGATRFQIFYKITLPLSKPIVVNVALTAFMSPWGEYVTSSFLMGGQTPEKTNWTVAKTLWAMLNSGDMPSRPAYWRSFCAGAVIVAIPTTLIFMFMQKYYVSGVTGGAVKG